MKYIITPVIALFFSVICVAQNASVKGRVLDAETNEPLIGALIAVEGREFGAAADLDGHYIIEDMPAGSYALRVSSMGYQEKVENLTLAAGEAAEIDFLLDSDALSLATVVVTARASRETENILLAEQRDALVATQAVGARELSRKGIGDAEAAVAQVSGISKQEGAKNVFVRGLGDRYNMTLLNGFPIPSEDPEYKNIALDFFSTDVIANIGVKKVFSAGEYGDAGGAMLDISSKILSGDYALGVDVSGGVNTAAIAATDFLSQDGSNYFGFAGKERPLDKRFSFQNKLDPTVVTPVNHGFGISGGKSFKIGENLNPLSFFISASHSKDFSFTEETLRNTISNGTVIQEQKGEKYSQNSRQLLLGNITYDINNRHNLQYNFMMIHAGSQYVGRYAGRNVYSYEQPDYMGILLRQQTNDNLLLVNQFSSKWTLQEKLRLEAGASYNTVSGNEPDRRENNFSQMPSGNYIFTSGDNQSRFYSELKDQDFNAKAALSYKLGDRFGSNNSSIKIGYNGRFGNNHFEGIRYRFLTSREEFNPDDLKMDDWYNAENQTESRANIFGKNFMMEMGTPDSYELTKSIHSGYVEASYQLLENLSGNVGLRMDAVDMTVAYKIQGFPGEQRNTENFLLPSLNLKYDISEKNSLRLGASKTYTLPQAKEMSPYQYVNVSFTSQGNPHLQSSENYNLDLKWDYYLSNSEILSVNAFYKHILNPIGRVDEGNSAGMLTYNNISQSATVAGVEMEMRKNIFNRFNTEQEKTSRLSAGVNASYIYSNLLLDISGTAPRNTQLEGASPFLANVDVSYTHSIKDRHLTTSLIFAYFSDRIHTLGAMGYNDIVEKGVATLHFAASYKFDKHWNIKAKLGNLLNQSHRLQRETSAGDAITLNEYKNGQDFSLGLSYEF
jgi:outer membrane receptor protein involved in Fe transport